MLSADESEANLLHANSLPATGRRHKIARWEGPERVSACGAPPGRSPRDAVDCPPQASSSAPPHNDLPLRPGSARRDWLHAARSEPPPRDERHREVPRRRVPRVAGGVGAFLRAFPLDDAPSSGRAVASRSFAPRGRRPRPCARSSSSSRTPASSAPCPSSSSRTASALMFTAPIIVTVLAFPLLGERVGLPRWVAVAVGFGGRPRHHPSREPPLRPLGAARARLGLLLCGLPDMDPAPDPRGIRPRPSSSTPPRRARSSPRSRFRGSHACPPRQATSPRSPESGW